MARRSTHPTTFMPLAAGYGALMGHHRHLLDDRVRTSALLRAVARTVRRGDVVVDLGTGTGILAMAARRAGASAVYAIERDPTIRLAAELARHNRIDGITWIEAHSRDVVLPERADVIVSECFGALAVGGTMIEAVCELRARAGKPACRVIPCAISLRAAPVESPGDHAFADPWRARRYGLDFAPARALSRHHIFNTRIEKRALLAPGAELGRIDLEHDAYTGAFTGEASYVARAGTLHGFAAWFEAALAPRITLSTAPGRPDTIWRQVFLPIEPIRLRAKTPVELSLAYTGGQFAWRVRAGDREQRFDTRASYPR